MMEMTSHFIQNLLFVVIISVVVFPFVNCNQNLQSANSLQNSANKNSTIKLCVTPGFTDNSKAHKTISIPALTKSQLTYNIKEFQVEPRALTECPNGQKPVSVSIGILALSEFEDKTVDGVDDIHSVLRNNHFILDNGVLSFANQEIKTLQYFPPNEFCITTLKENDSSVAIQLSICPVSNQNRTLLQKCCPMGMAYDKISHSCVPQNTSTKWEPVFMDVTTFKLLPMKAVNPIISAPLIDCGDGEREYWEGDNCHSEFYSTVDNRIAFLSADRTWEILSASNNSWCIDTTTDSDNERDFRMLVYCLEPNESPAHNTSISFIYMITMYIGAFFHLLTTLVYLITWPKQNVFGKIICSVTATLFFQHIFIGTTHLLGIFKTLHSSLLCYWISVGGQFSFIAAFTWLALFNFDLWNTIGSKARLKNAHRFRVYTCIGWLLPILVSGISLFLDLTFVCRTSQIPVPEFGVYYCFIAPWAQGLYLYYLLGILIAISCCFAVMTLISLCKKRNDRIHSTGNKIRVCTILKLTVVMGIGWCLEVISWALSGENENNIVWIIFDLYNALSSMFIFYICVCNLPTWNFLKNSIPWLGAHVQTAETKMNSSFSGPTMPMDSMPFTST